MDNKSYKTQFKEYFLNSTFVGLVKIFKSQKLISLFMWIIFNLISIATCAYFLLPAFVNYFSYPVVTNIQTVYQQPFEFPGFTLCDFSNKIQISSFIKSLKIGNNNADSSNYFAKYYDNCIRFNSGFNMKNHSIPIYSSNQGGYDDSIVILLNTNITFFIIHPREIPPRLSLDTTFAENFYIIKNGFEIDFKIEKIIEQKQGEPYNKCFKDVTKFNMNTTLVNFYKNSSLNYTQTDCLNLCFELYYINSNPCNCKTRQLDKIWDDCFVRSNDVNLKNCTFQNRLNFFANNVMNKCENYCPLECDSLNYVVENTVYFMQNIQNSALIRIYMKNLKYTLISQQPLMGINDLISNIGGMISLFVGISFISVFEIFELFFISIGCLCRRKKNQVNKIPRPSSIH